jgi:hypothetical protein
VVAGVHFPIDLTVGAMLGLTFGKYFVARAKDGANAKYDSWAFDGAAAGLGTADFDGPAVVSAVTGNGAPPPGLSLVASNVPCAGGQDALAWLWKRAVKEWQ